MAIDGIRVDEHLVVVAPDIGESGEKHVVGPHEGATENESVCKALIADVVARACGRSARCCS